MMNTAIILSLAVLTILVLVLIESRFTVEQATIKVRQRRDYK